MQQLIVQDEAAITVIIPWNASWNSQETRLSCIEHVWIGSPSPNVGFTGCLSTKIERKKAKNVNQWSFSYGKNRCRLFLVRSGMNLIKIFASVIYKCSFCFWTLKTIATLVTYTCRSIIKLTPGVFTFWSEKSFCLVCRHELHRQCHHFGSELISGSLTCALGKSLHNFTQS